jgi:hypothetical protein
MPLPDPAAAATAPKEPPRRQVLSVTPAAYAWINEVKAYLSGESGEHVTISRALLYAAKIERRHRGEGIES